MTLGGNTAGTSTFNASNNATLWLNGGNNITLSGNGSTVTISAAAQTNQTLGFYAVSNTEGASSSSTFDARTVSFQGKGAVSVGFSNGSVVIDAPSAAAGNVTFSAGANSGGLGSVVFSNSNGVSFGLNGSTITASVNAGGGGAGVGMSNLGNTAGTSGTVTAGNYVMVGSGAISLSQSSSGSNGTLSILAPATSSLVGTFGPSLSTNGSTVSISLDLMNQLDFFRKDNVLQTNSTLGQSSLYLYPVDVPWPFSGSRINMFLSIGTTNSAINSTGAGSYGLGYGLYTRGLGTASDRLSLLTSYSASLWTYTFSSNTRLGVTHYIGLSNATSHSTSTYSSAATNVSTYMANSLGGYRAVALPLNSTLTPGRYWLAISNQTTTTNATAFSMGASVLQQTNATLIAYRPFGDQLGGLERQLLHGRGRTGHLLGADGGVPEHHPADHERDPRPADRRRI
jgi:hypothetical protein